MKLSTLVFITFALGGEAIEISKHVRCMETLEGTEYIGTRCTVANISLPETSYNWGGVTQKELHFSNSVVPFVPDRLVEMMNQFEVLNMTNVTLQVLTSDHLRKASALKELNASHNKLTKIVNMTFIGAFSLEILDLSWNEIESIEEKAFFGMKNLKKIDLSHNSLTNVGTEFNELINLQKIDFSVNKISGIHLNATANLMNLNEFNVEQNQVQHLKLSLCNEFNLKLILSLNSMETVTLTWNPMSRFGLENSVEVIAPFNKIKNLSTDREINLVNVDLRGNGLSSIKGMKNLMQLKKLDLSLNQISEVNFTFLSSMKNLEQLNLSFNALKSLEVANIRQNLPKLKFLAFRGNFWESCVVLEDIVTPLKKAGIGFDMTEGEGELSCMLIEITETTENEEITTTDVPETTEEEFSTTIDENKEHKKVENDEDFKEKLFKFINSDFFRVLTAILLILFIIAVMIRMCLSCCDRRSKRIADLDTHI
ncbi:leucine-rich repeat transmembrane neuronal protein 2-like [Culicoides brevitarsis]|uniref:leucine-rich repeat transmembrane neuronal protein 2-like n=1 Tax=Culicoides brevitarsis TaxID=469753 RepID=UPI00307C55DB